MSSAISMDSSSESHVHYAADETTGSINIKPAESRRSLPDSYSYSGESVRSNFSIDEEDAGFYAQSSDDEPIFEEECLNVVRALSHSHSEDKTDDVEDNNKTHNDNESFDEEDSDLGTWNNIQSKICSSASAQTIFNGEGSDGTFFQDQDRSDDSYFQDEYDDDTRNDNRRACMEASLFKRAQSNRKKYFTDSCRTLMNSITSSNGDDNGDGGGASGSNRNNHTLSREQRQKRSRHMRTVVFYSICVALFYAILWTRKHDSATTIENDTEGEEENTKYIDFDITTLSSSNKTKEEILELLHSVRIKPPPDTIHDLCAYSDIISKTLVDLEGCNKACMIGKCCLIESVASSCVSQNEEVCSLYQTPCSHLPIHLLTIDFSSTNDNINTVELIPVAPNSLSIICSKNQIDSSTEMRDICESLCSVALCCIVDDSNDAICVKENEETCEEYVQYCYSVWEEDYMEQNVQPPTTTTMGTKTTTVAVSVSLLPPKKPLEVLCSQTSILTEQGMLACEDLCYLGACCWLTNLPTEVDCYDNNRDICDSHYSICSTIPFLSIVALSSNNNNNEDLNAIFVPKPISNLRQVCSTHLIITQEGYKSCVRQCQLGSCCFTSNEGENCYQDNSNVCEDYMPCLRVPMRSNNDNSIATVVQSPLEMICSPYSISTSAKNLNLCHKACQSGACCNIINNPPDNCYALHQNICEEYYTPCQSLIIVPKPPDDMQQICSQDLIQTTKGYIDCQSLCSAAKCCFHGLYDDVVDTSSFSSASSTSTYLGTCSFINPTTCPIYQSDCPKEIFHSQPQSQQQLQQSSQTNDNINITTTTSQLASKCSTEAIQTIKGRNECYTMCYPALCCFGQGKSSCEDTQYQFCHDYKPYCYDVLTETLNNQDEDITYYFDTTDTTTVSSSSNKIDSLKVTCSEEHILTDVGRLACERECSFAACCFSSGTFSCGDTSKEMCKTYQSICNILQTFNFQEEKIASYAPFNINDLCSDENIYESYTGKEVCEEVCAPSNCCWDVDDGMDATSSSSSSNCKENNKDACESYRICEKLLMNTYD